MQQPKEARRGRGWGLMKEHTLGPSTAWPQAEPTAGRGARRTRRCSEGGHFRGNAAAPCSWITRSRGRQRSVVPGHPGRRACPRDGPAGVLRGGRLRRPPAGKKVTEPRVPGGAGDGGGVLGAEEASGRQTWSRGQQPHCRPQPGRHPVTTLREAGRETA